MKKIALIAVALAGVHSAFALTTISTLASENGTISTYGVPNTATYGQTFIAPSATDTVLDSVQFKIDPLGTGDVNVRLHVGTWTGTKVGSLIYTGSLVTLGSGLGWTNVVYSNLGINVVHNQAYVAFASVSNDYIGGTAQWASSTAASYGNGTFVFLNNGNDAGQWTTTNWTSAGIDATFEMNFVNAIPEPTTMSLLALGAAGLIAKRRRRA